MREIKFRCWDKEKKKMRYFTSDSQILTDGPTTGLVFWTDGYYPEWDTFSSERCLVDQLILMQYTGLKDKNGKEIYEGDVIEYSTGKRVEIKWSQGECGRTGGWTGWNENNDFESERFVIGNIYENPELIK